MREVERGTGFEPATYLLGDFWPHKRRGVSVASERIAVGYGVVTPARPGLVRQRMVRSSREPALAVTPSPLTASQSKIGLSAAWQGGPVRRWSVLLGVTAIVLAACSGQATFGPTPSAAAPSTPTPSPTDARSPTRTPRPTPTPSPTAGPPGPAGLFVLQVEGIGLRSEPGLDQPIQTIAPGAESHLATQPHRVFPTLHAATDSGAILRPFKDRR